MDEDDGKVVTFDEVDMQDLIDDWSRNYAQGVQVQGWYYDCRQATVVIRLVLDTQEDSEAD